MSTLLQLKGLRKSYPSLKGENVIVKDFDLDIADREFVCLIGHSGCGKTTVLSMVAGLTKPSGGEIILDGQHVKGPGPDRGMVFQSPSLLPTLSALGNVLLAADQVYPHASKAERKDLSEYYLRQMGLGEHLNRMPAELSTGMRQRVGVARAFVLSPRMLLLDEPFGSLDSITRFELQRVLLEMRWHTKTTSLMVTHDIDEALYLSDRIVMMTDGPAATVGDILQVPFARPRDRHALLEDSEYYRLREYLIDFLENRAGHRGPAAHTAA